MENLTETTDKTLCIFTRNNCENLTMVTGIITTADIYNKYQNKIKETLMNVSTAKLASSYSDAKLLADGVFSNDVAIVCPKEIGLEYGLKCLKELN